MNSKQIRKILKDNNWKRWIEAENYIRKCPRLACDYVFNAIKCRWPEVEHHIMKDPNDVYCYAKNIIKGRWPEAEPFIMKYPVWIFYYARDIIKNKWPEAEPHIMEDPTWIFYYARDIIKNRWPEAEPFLFKDSIAIRLNLSVIRAYFQIVVKDKTQFVLDNIKILPELINILPEKEFPTEIRNKYHELFKMKKLGLL